MLDAGCRNSEFGVRNSVFRMQDTEYRMPDAGYLIPDAGCRIQDDRYRNLIRPVNRPTGSIRRRRTNGLNGQTGSTGSTDWIQDAGLKIYQNRNSIY